MSRVYVLLLAFWTLPAWSQPETLDQLLQQVTQERAKENQINEEREQRFLADRNKQREILDAAKSQVAREEARSQALRAEYDQNDAALTLLKDTLAQSMGDLGELHGVTRQIAGDFKGLLESSLVSAQIPRRAELPGQLAESKEMPSIRDLEALWELALGEIVESGKVTRFKAPVAASDGTTRDAEVIRVGVFNAITDGKYLRHLPETGQLVLTEAQPSSRFLGMAEDLEDAQSGITMMAVDPARGSLLALLTQSPNLIQRIRQGGVIGYLILALGALALFIVCERFATIGLTTHKVRQQMQNGKPAEDNPLGRLRLIERDNPHDDAETLSLKLDQAILKEIPRVRRMLPTLAVFATAAPLMGLLGTVAGMIETFQSMTLFGAGDPKLVAGGISLALVATLLGLLVAIPILLLHSWLHGASNRLIHTLEEEIAGIIARREEQTNALARKSA
jgi:biopolymer transport protein ExbB